MKLCVSLFNAPENPKNNPPYPTNPNTSHPPSNRRSPGGSTAGFCWPHHLQFSAEVDIRGGRGGVHAFPCFFYFTTRLKVGTPKQMQRQKEKAKGKGKGKAKDKI